MAKKRQENSFSTFSTSALRGFILCLSARFFRNCVRPRVKVCLRSKPDILLQQGTHTRAYIRTLDCSLSPTQPQQTQLLGCSLLASLLSLTHSLASAETVSCGKRTTTTTARVTTTTAERSHAKFLTHTHRALQRERTKAGNTFSSAKTFTSFDGGRRRRGVKGATGDAEFSYVAFLCVLLCAHVCV